jgi:hypothetical protein
MNGGSRTAATSMSSRFCLRYQAIDFVLGDATFICGRVAECDLVLDDNLVSRKHASFRVIGETVELSDLASRNGVTVNGSAVKGNVLLRRGDRVRIGSQELVLVDAVESAQRDTGTAELIRCRSCGAFLEVGTPCPTCSATAQVPIVPALKTGKANLVSGLGSTLLADKAFSLGRFDEAERLLSGRLNAMLSASDTERTSMKTATHYALKLAVGLHKPSWLDYPFELYAAARVLMPAETIEELYKVAARVRYVNPHALRRYVSALRAASSEWGANERFLLQRLEGLERRIVSG